MRWRTLVLGVVVLSLVVTPLGAVSPLGTATAQQAQSGEISIQGEPEIQVFTPDNIVTPGEETVLEVQIANDGEVRTGPVQNREIVTTARNVRVRLSDNDTPIRVKTGQQSIGSVTDSAPGTASFQISVPDDIEPGTYDLEARVRYSFTGSFSQRSDVISERSRTVTRTVRVHVDESARFAVTDVSTDAQVGDEGTVAVTYENVGDEVAENARVAVESTSPRMTFGQSTADEAFVGTWEPGEERTVEYDVAFAPDASVRSYTLESAIQFRNQDGVQSADTGVFGSVTPIAEQSFSFDDVESTLRVGEEGEIRGTVVNDGPQPVDSVVIRFAGESQNVFALESEFAVGSLDAGESESFRIPLEIGSEAEPTQKLFDAAIQYRNAAGERRVDEDNDLVGVIDERRPEFLVSTVTREITAGSSQTIEFDVTNNRDGAVSDVEAKLFADSPLDSSDDEAYIESLGPGETETIRFELSAQSGATAKTYPISMDFRYDDERGKSKVSDTVRAPIDVIESDDDGLPLPLIGGAALVIAALIGVFWWRRQ